MPFKVTATSLNLRSEPKVTATNRIAVLPNGQLVDKLGEDTPPWWNISTQLGGATLTGFVSSEFLANQSAPPPAPPVKRLVSVHLTPTKGKRAEASSRAFPLGEPGQPQRGAATPAGRITDLRNIVKWLDVERKARYSPGSSQTFCNIYAYDYCFLAGAFLPRVWWTSNAVADLRAGKSVAPKYDSTVRELNANSLYNWLQDFGAEFGWTRVPHQNDLQNAANQGKVAVICAQRVDLNRSGHICMVAPEEPPARVASRSGGVVNLPLQSQAGAKNFSYSTGTTRWWAGSQFRAFGFWVHD